jgi:hypothetical protein
MTITGPAAAAARATALELSASYGPGLEAKVEAALHTRIGQRPGQYPDPVSIASLIVDIATLAWTIYNDQRQPRAKPTPKVIQRRVRKEIRQQSDTSPNVIEEITEIVVTHITHANGDTD